MKAGEIPRRMPTVAAPRRSAWSASATYKVYGGSPQSRQHVRFSPMRPGRCCRRRRNNDRPGSSWNRQPLFLPGGDAGAAPRGRDSRTLRMARRPQPRADWRAPARPVPAPRTAAAQYDGAYRTLMPRAGPATTTSPPRTAWPNRLEADGLQPCRRRDGRRRGFLPCGFSVPALSKVGPCGSPESLAELAEAVGFRYGIQRRCCSLHGRAHCENLRAAWRPAPSACRAFVLRRRTTVRVRPAAAVAAGAARQAVRPRSRPSSFWVTDWQAACCLWLGGGNDARAVGQHAQGQFSATARRNSLSPDWCCWKPVA